MAACQTQASQAAPPATTSAPAPQGGRIRGAAVGAAAGAASAEVKGNQYQAYDKLDSDVQQQYRQNQAQSAAAAGAVAGAAQQRQQRRQSQQQQQQQQAAAQSQQKSSDAFNACMGARGYSVAP
jgi:transcription initiation factor TFIID subunit TAF12